MLISWVVNYGNWFFKNYYVTGGIFRALLDIFHRAFSLRFYGVFSGPYFPVFGLNTEIYGVSKSWKQKKHLNYAVQLLLLFSETNLRLSDKNCRHVGLFRPKRETTYKPLKELWNCISCIIRAWSILFNTDLYRSLHFLPNHLKN